MCALKREQLEDRELLFLSPHAVRARDSRGRPVPESKDSYRTVFQQDRDRIIHTKAFRRLKRKTQVFLAPEDDHYRTRLTHTLEVAQIARTIARALCLNEDLVEAIALAHDLGHTPFGHAGETVLNEVFPGGFKHNEQSLRVVDVLERRGNGMSLNLTHEVREGILAHSYGKVIFYGQEPPPMTLESLVVSISDAIAYINHDIDDALRAGIITHSMLPECCKKFGRSPSDRIHAMVTGVIEGSEEGRIGVQPEIGDTIRVLRDFLYQKVYPSDPIEQEISKARTMVRELYYTLREDPTQVLENSRTDDSTDRCIVDFIAGMTDEYAIRLHHTLVKSKRSP